MAYTETTHQGWFSRLKSAIGGVLFGILLFFGSFILIFWNEGRTVHTAAALSEGKGSVVTIQADSVDSSYEGKLVHLTGLADTKETLRDPQFGVSMQALRLAREVEMYQWEEKSHSKTEKKTGGGTVTTTTYTYNKTWSNRVISSSGFKESGHDNPTSMPVQGQSWQASTVTVGAFNLTQSQVGSISNWEQVPVEQATSVPHDMRRDGSYLFKGRGSVSSPEVGDVRIKFRVVKPCTISLYAKQTGSTFAPYVTRNKTTLQRLQVGAHSAEEMFEAAETENTIMAWVLRFVGFFMMWIGLVMIFKPLEVVADVIPFIGNLVGAGISMAAFGLAAPLTFMTIAIGWIVYRPLLGILLMAVGIAIFVGVYKVAVGIKAAKTAKAANDGDGQSPPTAPPPIPA